MPHFGEWPGKDYFKMSWRDHDTYVVNEAPPNLNEWYEAFDLEDASLIWCRVRQTNTETAAKDVEVRWTIDGNPYFTSVSLESGTWQFVYRSMPPSSGGTAGLTATAASYLAAYYAAKHGQSFKVEVRITSALGTAQTLRCECVPETLEQT